MYLFFSSDSNELYRKDIISTLALPENYCIHFRYDKAFVSSDVFLNYRKARGKDGIIVYVQGNRGEPAEDRNLKFLPIRNVLVEDCYFEESTNLIHYFLRLGKIVDADGIPLNNSSHDIDLPPNNFVSSVQTCGSVVIPWHLKIKKLIEFDSKFKNSLLFNINIRNREKWDNLQTLIDFDFADKSSSFRMYEGKIYVLELSIFNSAEDGQTHENYFLDINNKSEDIFISNPERIMIGAEADNRSYKIITKEIKSSKALEFIKFRSLTMDSDKEIELFSEILQLNIRRNISILNKRVGFAILGLMSTGGIAVLSSEFGKDHISSGAFIPCLFIALIFYLFSMKGQFYYTGNKN